MEDITDTVIGSGTYANIYLSKDGKYVYKVLDTEDSVLGAFVSETSALLTLKNKPGILDISKINAKSLTFRMEKYPHTIGSKFAHPNHAGEHVAKKILFQLLLTIHESHSMFIIHRDIKPGNILVDENNIVKLIDWGLAKFDGMNLSKTYTDVQTPTFKAPEIAKNRSFKGESDERIDIYTIGLVYYWMTGNKTKFELYSDIENNFAVLQNLETPSDDLENLLDGMLKYDPKKRFTAAQCLNHPYFGVGHFSEFNINTFYNHRVINCSHNFINDKILDYLIQIRKQLKFNKSLLVVMLTTANYVLNIGDVSHDNTHLILLGSCLLVSEFLEAYPMTSSDLNKICGNKYSADIISRTSITIYRIMGFNLCFLTPITVVNYISKKYDMPIQKTIIDKLVAVIVNREYYYYSPVTIAIASILSFDPDTNLAFDLPDDTSNAMAMFR
jgi:serine/threonine protein kinase